MARKKASQNRVSNTNVNKKTGSKRAYNKRNSQSKNTIFICWSGENSKEIAHSLKKCIQEIIFPKANIDCFMSDVDIDSGEDWWKKIKQELKCSKLGIVCITEENLRAPWIYFESGAIVARDLKLIPLLINCDMQALAHTPLAQKNMVDIYNKEDFYNMIHTIKRECNIEEYENEYILKQRAENAYINWMRCHKMKAAMKKLKHTPICSEFPVYPEKIRTKKPHTLYISAPMSSISPEEYEELQLFLVHLKTYPRDRCFAERSKH